MRLLILLISIVTLSTQVCAQVCSYSSGVVTITPATAMSCAIVNISGDATVIIDGNTTLTNGKIWTIAPSANVIINGSLTIGSGIGSGSIINNYGTFEVAGTTNSEFKMNAGTFNNHGRFNVKNANFIMKNGARFINEDNSVVVIHNSIEDNKKVQLGSPGSGNEVPFANNGLHIKSGSVFAVFNTDMHSVINGTSNEIGGELHVVDGNLTIEDARGSTGSAGINIKTGGGLYVVDTDLNDVHQKGQIIVPNGAKETFNVEGDLFATGLQGDSNNKITGSNGQVVIGNIDDSDSFKQNQFNGSADFCSASSPDFDECYDAFLNHTRYDSFLPIELSAFSVQAIAEGAFVTWTTQSEKDNDFFTVLRSNDGYIFEEITRLSGAYTSSAAIDYSFTDTHPYSGISYYRLKQTDYDGKYSYSSVVPFLFNTQEPTFEIVAHTQNGISTLDIHFFKTEAVNYIALYTLQGKQLYYQAIPAGIDNHTTTLPLPAGIYVASHSYNNSKQSEKITVQ